MIKYRFILYLIFLSLSNFVQSQTLYEKVLVAEFEEKARKNARPIEYLQTDKDIYETGEQLWFKFLQLDGQFLSPYQGDSILYLRLVNQISREVFWEEKYGIYSGFTDGMVLLNENLNPGIYNLEAYSPSSVYHEMKDYHAFKEIEIRQFINPEIIIRHNLSDQDDYSDTLNLIVSDKQGNRLSDAKIQITWLNSKRKSIHETTFQSNLEGRLEIPLNRTGSQWIDLDVTLGNKHVFQRIELKDITNPKEITFHPESGKLIHNQESFVMLSAAGDNNENQTRQGVLLKDGEILQFINMGSDGLGKFKVKPEKGSSYRILWNDTPSDTMTVFDQIEDRGVTINLNTLADTLLMTIQTSWPGQKHFLRLQVRGIVHVFHELILEDNSQIKIPLTNIPSGIAEIAIFNDQAEPLGERLTWIENNGKLIVEAKLNQQEYGSREKVKVTFTVKDSKGTPLEGVQLGGTVSDKLYQNSRYNRSLYTFAHIITQMGTNPNLESILSLSEENDFRKINNILESSNIEKYIWLEQKFENYRTVEYPLGNKLTGQIKYRNSSKENDSKYGLLFRGDNEGNTAFIPLDQEGNFEIYPEELDFGKDEYLYIKALPKGSNEIILKIKDPFEELSSILKTARFNFPSIDYGGSNQKLDLPTFDRNMILLSEFVVRGKRMEQDREKFIGELAERAKFDFNDDFVCQYGDLLNCPICSYTDKKPIEGKEYLVITGDVLKIAGGSHYIIKKDPSYTHSHKIYEYPKYTDEELMKLYNMTRTKGFFVGSGFQFKEYPDHESKNDPEADYRNTLGWYPYLFTDSNGKAEIELYTSDNRSIFAGNFEVLSADGKMGKVNFEFVVK
ncbi:hypothetical protein Belba_1637 [Belliella baltica DSM 15883]|uniref:Large extracellular alpha-helical protein n=1 Tax=Belliella baltica (strain DSM 15883 / CIP 108006 / LMG 21964 / BA134) TaxID=866536 RepID=I3Z4S5_BELBD|nr:hypothetical protein Belba_1637 [Belliella baltica DSM 15883]